MTRTLIVVAAVTLLAALPAVASAQSTGATLQGTVGDARGAALPGVAILVTNAETGLAREQATDDRGWYRVPALPPGRYELRAEPRAPRQLRSSERQLAVVIVWHADGYRRRAAASRNWIQGGLLNNSDNRGYT